MDSFFKTLLGSFASYLLIWIYLLLPASNTLYKFFPFHKQTLSKQTYIDYISWRVLLCALFFMMWQLAIDTESRYKNEFGVFFFLWVGFLIDFLLIYNDPGIYLKGSTFFTTKPSGLFLPIGYPLVMGVVMFVTILIAAFK